MVSTSFCRFFALAAAAVIPSALAATNFTGDILNGVPVIKALDLSDVPAGNISRYYLRLGELNGGLPLHIPVAVARGTAESLETGKKLSLSASIHGDELNGARVAQLVLGSLADRVEHLNGTVIIIPQMNPVGNYLNQRNFFTAQNSGFLTNLNRVFPGSSVEDGASFPSYIAYQIWNNVWGNTSQVDVALDLHTSSTGADSPLWCYADFRLPYVERLAKLLQPDTLKIDPGEPGSVETTFVGAGVPAITVEMGAAKRWNYTNINRTVDFIERLMVDLAILPSDEYSAYNGSNPYVPDLSDTYIINAFQSVSSSFGGWTNRRAGPQELVTEGQPLADVLNEFGDILETAYAPASGKIHQSPYDATIEPGASVAQLAFNSTDPDCEFGCIL